MTQQHHQTPPKYRLLLLLAAGAAGVALSLALSDDAHASDRDHTGPVAGTIADVTTLTAPADSHRPRQVKPKPIRKALDPPAKTIRHLTGNTVEQATTTLPPALTKPVTPTTNLIRQVTDTARDTIGGTPIRDTVSRLRTPTATTPPAGTRPPQTAPEQTAPAPPREAASSGAPTIRQHPTAARPAATHNPAAADTGTAWPTQPRNNLAGDPDRQTANSNAGSSNTHAAPNHTWTAPRTTGTPANGQARAYTGRTHPPSPPTG